MPIIKDLGSSSFIKVSRDALEELSNNALIVYTHFVSVYPEIDPTNEYMAKKCNMGMARYKKAKAELQEMGYLYVKRLGGKGANIIYYVGKDTVYKYKK